MTIDLQRIGQISLALKLYAGDNDGRLPAKLADLSPMYLQGNESQFRDPVTGKLADWIYYPGHKLDDPTDTILAASPVPVTERAWIFMSTKHRIITTVGDRIELIDEADFQRRLRSSQSHK